MGVLKEYVILASCVATSLKIDAGAALDHEAVTAAHTRGEGENYCQRGLKNKRGSSANRPPDPKANKRGLKNQRKGSAIGRRTPNPASVDKRTSAAL